jgi:hypothetical protein
MGDPVGNQQGVELRGFAEMAMMISSIAVIGLSAALSKAKSGRQNAALAS